VGRKHATISIDKRDKELLEQIIEARRITYIQWAKEKIVSECKVLGLGYGDKEGSIETKEEWENRRKRELHIEDLRQQIREKFDYIADWDYPEFFIWFMDTLTTEDRGIVFGFLSGRKERLKRFYGFLLLDGNKKRFPEGKKEEYIATIKSDSRFKQLLDIDYVEFF